MKIMSIFAILCLLTVMVIELSILLVGLFHTSKTLRLARKSIVHTIQYLYLMIGNYILATVEVLSVDSEKKERKKKSMKRPIINSFR
jgi:hypothetical protein